MRLISPPSSFSLEILLLRISSLFGIRIANLFRNYLLLYYKTIRHFIMLKPPKKKKGNKNLCDFSGVSSRLLPLLERWDRKPNNSFCPVFRLYQRQLLNKSISDYLIDARHLSPAGDGTLVRTAIQQHKKWLCNCLSDGYHNCNCKRHYSQPDCD